METFQLSEQIKHLWYHSWHIDRIEEKTILTILMIFTQKAIPYLL